MKIYSVYTEEELYAGCQRRVPSIQEAVFEAFRDAMYAVCCRYVKETAAAEDVLIIGFTKAFEKIDQFKATGSFRGWIRRIIINECLMYLEKEKSLYQEIGLEGILPASLHAPADDLGMDDLQKLINSLPIGYRTVFNLYAIEGYSHHEISAQLKISENTSKSQLCRARCHLQKMIKGNGANRPRINHA